MLVTESAEAPAPEAAAVQPGVAELRERQRIDGVDAATFGRLLAGHCFPGSAALRGCCDVNVATRGSSIGLGDPAMVEGGGLGVLRPDEISPGGAQSRWA